MFRFGIFAISLVMIWVILVSMSMQGILAITPFSTFLPFEIGARFVGFFGATPFLLFFPGIVSAALGIIGTILSWPFLFYEAFLALEPDPDPSDDEKRQLIDISKAIDTTLRVLVPGFSWIKEEPIMEYSPYALSRDEPSKLLPQKFGPETYAKSDEVWIYINGVATPKNIAERNCVKLNKLFHQKIHLVHNPTDSVLFDLLECIMGKTGLLAPLELWFDAHITDRLVKSVANHIEKAHAMGKKRVVLIAHSQGTIITSNALKELGKKDAAFLLKMKNTLEVYNFANCAHQTPDQNVKYLENIHNQGDVVAWLGVLFPMKKWWPDAYNNTIDIRGSNVNQPGFWGHMLNTHYLTPMMRNRDAYKMSKLRNPDTFKYSRSTAMIANRSAISPEREIAKLK